MIFFSNTQYLFPNTQYPLQASVTVANLVADYGNKPLIRNLSFTLTHPAFIAILGHNGSGKTTLLKALTRQIPYRGTVLIGDHALTSRDHPVLDGSVALLGQHNQVGFSIPVRELVVMGRYRYKSFLEPYNAADYQAVEEALRFLRMDHLATADFRQLSGGEQQMVWLAQMMVQDAALFLLDEPTQHLDVRNKKQVFTLMQQWVDQYRKTVLCVTHDLYNLFAMQGLLLNLSMPEPALEPINESTLRRHIAWLEGD